MLLNYWAKTNSDELAKRIRKYQKAYGNKYRESANELVNDTLAEIFANEKAMRDMAVWMATNESKADAKTIKQVITDYIQTIKDIIADIKNLKKQGLTYDSRLKFTDEECDKLMKAITTAMDEGIASRDRVAESSKTDNSYSYDSLKPSEKFVVNELNDSNLIKDFDRRNRKEIIATAKQNIEIYKGSEGNALSNKYIGKTTIGKSGLSHALQSHFSNENAEAVAFLPLYFENAIVVNEAEGMRKNADKSYILLGAYNSNGNSRYVRVVVNKFSNEISDIESLVLYATNAKKEDGATNVAKAFNLNPSSNLKIGEFLEKVKELFPNEQSKFVLGKYRKDYPCFCD